MKEEDLMYWLGVGAGVLVIGLIQMVLKDVPNSWHIVLGSVIMVVSTLFLILKWRKEKKCKK